MRALGRHIKVGQMDRVMSIHIPDTTTDDRFNTPVPGPPTVIQAWAHKMPKSGDEMAISDQETNKKVVEWVIRYEVVQPDARMWLEVDGIKYDVKDWEEVGRKRYWIIKSERRL